eukprot:COSAG01_NODE_6057_length_3876_cov_2.004766_1_plen_78_part_10
MMAVLSLPSPRYSCIAGAAGNTRTIAENKRRAFIQPSNSATFCAIASADVWEAFSTSCPIYQTHAHTASYLSAPPPPP